MAFATVMVPLDLGSCSLDRLKLAGSLAERFDARLIGVAARQALPARYYGKGSYVTSAAIDVAYRRVADELVRVQSKFEEVTAQRNRAEFRSARSDPMAYLALQARAADLVVLNRYDEESNEDWCSSVEPGELILRLGRPVLVAPPHVDDLVARRIVVAWKDTREARRAVWDSLPFLKAADEVFVIAVGVDPELSGARDVVGHLAQHGVVATTISEPVSHAGIAPQILAIAKREDADLIVAGAYGHSRMREMMFGSVTRHLLQDAPICCLLSH